MAIKSTIPPAFRLGTLLRGRGISQSHALPGIVVWLRSFGVPVSIERHSNMFVCRVGDLKFTVIACGSGEGGGYRVGTPPPGMAPRATWHTIERAAEAALIAAGQAIGFVPSLPSGSPPPAPRTIGW